MPLSLLSQSGPRNVATVCTKLLIWDCSLSCQRERSSLWVSVALASIFHASNERTTCASSTLRALAIHVADPRGEPAVGISKSFISTDLMLEAYPAKSKVLSIFHCKAYLFPIGLQIYPLPSDLIACQEAPLSPGPSKFYGDPRELLRPNLQSHH